MFVFVYVSQELVRQKKNPVFLSVFVGLVFVVFVCVFKQRKDW